MNHILKDLPLGLHVRLSAWHRSGRCTTTRTDEWHSAHRTTPCGQDRIHGHIGRGNRADQHGERTAEVDDEQQSPSDDSDARGQTNAIDWRTSVVDYFDLNDCGIRGNSRSRKRTKNSFTICGYDNKYISLITDTNHEPITTIQSKSFGVIFKITFIS